MHIEQIEKRMDVLLNTALTAVLHDTHKIPWGTAALAAAKIMDHVWKVYHAEFEHDDKPDGETPET